MNLRGAPAHRAGNRIRPFFAHPLTIHGVNGVGLVAGNEDGADGLANLS